MKHGASGYSGGCRCEDCKSGHRNRMREWKRLRDGFYEAPRTRTCERCGETFDLPRHGSAAKKRFCSRKCQHSRPGATRRRAERIVASAAKGTAGTSVFIVHPDGSAVEAQAPAEYWAEAQKSPLRRAVERKDGPGVIAAILADTRRDGDCRLWTRATTDDGYAKVKVGRKTASVHRLIAEAVHGPLSGMAIHHKCANTTCVAPGHLQPVTQYDNAAEMLARNWYLKRIASLESALALAAPNHPLLDVRAHHEDAA